jgi:hypothetical protein
MGLKDVSYPKLELYDLSKRKAIKVDISNGNAKLKKNKRARGPGYTYRIHVEDGSRTFSRILSESGYAYLNKKLGGKSSPKRKSCKRSKKSCKWVKAKKRTKSGKKKKSYCRSRK